MPAAWGAAIGAVGSIAGGLLQSSAVSGASSASIKQAEKAAQLATQGYAPFIDVGKASLPVTANLLGLAGPEAGQAAMDTFFRASPGYQYQLDQGLRAVDQGAAARGMTRSGATLKAEQTLGNNLASQDFGNYLNRLNGLTQLGYGGTAGVINAAVGQANNIQQTLTSAGGQQASILGNTTSGITGALSNLNKGGLLDNLFGVGGSTAASNPLTLGNFGTAIGDTSGGVGMGLVGGLY